MADIMRLIFHELARAAVFPWQEPSVSTPSVSVNPVKPLIKEFLPIRRLSLAA